MRRQRLSVTATAVGMLFGGMAFAIVTATAAHAGEQPARTANVLTGDRSGPVLRALTEVDDPDDTPTRSPHQPPKHTPPEQLPVPCIGCP